MLADDGLFIDDLESPYPSDYAHHIEALEDALAEAGESADSLDELFAEYADADVYGRPVDATIEATYVALHAQVNGNIEPNLWHLAYIGHLERIVTRHMADYELAFDLAEMLDKGHTDDLLSDARAYFGVDAAKQAEWRAHPEQLTDALRDDMRTRRETLGAWYLVLGRYASADGLLMKREW